VPTVHSILPIVIALATGYVMGRIVAARVSGLLIKLIAPLVWALLFLIGSEFGEVISSAHAVSEVLKRAGIFAPVTTVMPSVLILLTGEGVLEAPATRAAFTLRHIWPPLRDCLIALLMVLLGSIFFLLNQTLFTGGLSLPSSSALLLVLIVLVGVDLTQVKIDARWLSLSTLSVPVLVVVGSMIGGLTASWVTGENLKTSLALSSGFGWFTLSSVLIGDKLGQTYGTMALMTNLLRDLLAIVTLYAIGRRYPKLTIGIAGATAMDSTLPIIKQACPPAAVPMALISGLIITILAPILMTLILSSGRSQNAARSSAFFETGIRIQRLTPDRSPSGSSRPSA
jgi:uncharacterized membrane protein YbjE (DUF340 family)